MSAHNLSVRSKAYKTIAQAIRRVRTVVRPGALVLGYHRIAEADWDPFGICVSPENFAEQMDVVASLGQVVDQAGLIAAVRGREELRGKVLVTFDDGYLDTLEVAGPILRRQGLRATAFVSTGLLERRYWWAEVSHQVGAAVSLPDSLAVSTGGREFLWRRGPSASRNQLANELGDFFRSISPDHHPLALDELRDQLSSGASGRSNVMPMSKGDVRRAIDCGTFDVGSHGVTHTSFSRLSDEQQRCELVDSKTELEEITGRPVITFSYPNGRVGDHSRLLAEKAGYDACFISKELQVARGCDLMATPRVWPGNWSGLTFRRWLRRFAK